MQFSLFGLSVNRDLARFHLRHSTPVSNQGARYCTVVCVCLEVLDVLETL